MSVIQNCCSTDPSSKSNNASDIPHNAPFCNRNVHTRANFCHKMVHCEKWDCCNVGFVQQVYCLSGPKKVSKTTSTYWPFVMGIHQWIVVYLHKWLVTRKTVPYRDVLMIKITWQYRNRAKTTVINIFFVSQQAISWFNVNVLALITNYCVSHTLHDRITTDSSVAVAYLVAKNMIKFKVPNRFGVNIDMRRQ